MRTAWRWARIGGLTLLGLTAIVAAVLGWLAWASLPQVSGEAVVAGLGQPTALARDEHGIPHVEASSMADAAFALGFLHGQDRLWQMEFDRLVGQGRLAEVLGEAALPIDRFLRTLGLARHAQAALATLPTPTRALLEAYAAGVNAAIDRFGTVLPPEFLILRHRPEPWRAGDVLLFQKLMALDLSGNWRTELLRARLAQRLTPAQMADLWPGQPAGSPVTLAGLAGLPLDQLAEVLPEAPPPGIGSNVWVADGSRTRDGSPLLANDPHLQLQAPGRWYLAQLRAPGLDVIGATLPGMPFVVLGRNEHIAWGFTNTGSDTQDLFIERLDPADPGRYLTPEGSVPFRTRTETIGVRDAAPVTMTVRETRHGPVVSDLVPGAAELAGSARVLALAWTQLSDSDTTVEAGFAIGRARDWPGFVAAVELYQGAQQNMAFADDTGTIGMISPGAVPIRRGGDGSLPVPGWTGEYDWLGTIPAEALPRELQPSSGLLVNANNRLVPASYPYLLTNDWEPSLRAQRIQGLLGTARNLDAEAFAAIQLDATSPLATQFVPFLLAAGADGPHRDMLAALAAWDGRMRADRPEPLLFTAWYKELAAAVYADELGPLFPSFRGLRPDFMREVLEQRPVWCDDVRTPTVETCPEQIRKAFAQAVSDLTAVYGPDWRRWRWGEAHPAVMAHRPFEQSEWLRRWFSVLFPIGGDGSTVDVAAYGPTRDEIPFGAIHGPGYRAIYDLGAGDRSRWIIALGQSGHPLSRHYADLSELWRDGRYLPMQMRAEGERETTDRVLLLRPATMHGGSQ